MTLPVFVVEPGQLGSDTIELTGDEGRHAAVVMRLRVGERLLLTDGQGAGAECAVTSVSKAGLTADVVARHDEPAPLLTLTVVQAIPKGDHAERAVDLLTEVGVDRVIPWAADRNVVNWRGERAEKALARWRSTARAAAKQSRRLRFPVIEGLHTTAEAAAVVAAADAALVLHEQAMSSISAYPLPATGQVVLVVGPEGGITDDELATFAAAGAHPVLLGPTVLRSSTAGVVAAATVLSRTTRWA